MSADLHCYTKLSSSSMGIDDLIALAKKKGVTTLAITDHDCQAGSIRGKIIAKRKGIDVIPAVEISARDKVLGHAVHIISYYSDHPDRLEEYCHRNTLARKKAGQYMILKVSQRYPISPELVLKCTTGSIGIFKEHIMHALMECGITDTIYGDIHDELFSKESEKNVIIEPPFASVEEVIEAIHSAGGIAVLATPFKDGSFSQLDRYVELGLDGVEAWCPSHTDEQTEIVLAYAKNHELLVTGGSEFSGMYSKGRVSVGDYTTPEDALKALVNYKAALKRSK